MMDKVQERFEAKFIKSESSCWNWVAYKKKNGYGQFWFEGYMRLAHRVSYQLYVGEITDNLQVLHKCDNPACVRPSHLFLGTIADNMHDCVNKGRNRYMVHSGEKHGSAILTEDEVKTIREMWANGARQVDLAKQFGVSQPTISGIVHYRSWAKI